MLVSAPTITMPKIEDSWLHNAPLISSFSLDVAKLVSWNHSLHLCNVLKLFRLDCFEKGETWKIIFVKKKPRKTERKFRLEVISSKCNFYRTCLTFHSFDKLYAAEKNLCTKNVLPRKIGEKMCILKIFRNSW